MSRTTAPNRSFAVLLALTLVAAAPAQEPELEAPADAAESSIAAYIESLRHARDGLITARDFEAALSPAEIVIKEIEGAGAAANADKLVLAYILAELARFDEAETLYFETIEKISEAEGESSASLILPLRLLGRSYIGARMFPQAIAVLQEARDISHRHQGLFNVEQVGLIDDMTTAYLATGDTVTARDLQTERLTIAERRFGHDDPQVIPFHNQLADYLERSRLHRSAREQYEAVLTILESQPETKPSDLLEPLRNIARLDLMAGARREALERIVSITSTTTDIDARELGLSLAVLGDERILAEEPDMARDYYARAYALLDRDGADPNAVFSQPSIVRFVPPLTPVDRGARSLPYAWGTVAIQFDVDADGRVETIKRSGSEPTNAIELDYVERLRQAYFRPRLVDGEPVVTEDVQMTHYFRYYVDDEEDESEAKP
jgi:tetratricopeptide (TPR) repeat protein